MKNGTIRLKQLIRDLEEVTVRGSKEVLISGLANDSRTVAPGDLFIARKGTTVDGGQFIQAAVQAGAMAIVTDLHDPFIEKTQIIHPRPASLEPLLAARFFRHPSRELRVIGVTGTKGKTTSCYLIRHILGARSGLITTVETKIGPLQFASRLTTHDPIFNQKFLREMVDQGCNTAVFEVSSHGLEQGRVDEIVFDTALFTNLYPDHLDYHQTMEEYAKAKAKLFEKVEGTAVVNADSPWSDRMIGGKRRLTFGIEKGADIQASSIHYSPSGTSLLVNGIPFTTSLVGTFNVYNLLGALGVLVAGGTSLEELGPLVSTFQNAPGRLEPIPNERHVRVFVDYAHNAESLENVLTTLRASTVGQLIVVFGCGGNRDPLRRSGMGRVADALADKVILTTDNPRNEDPQLIMEQILAGFSDRRRPLIEPDRKKAIELAMQLASPEDTVLIAGKGHEKVQIFAHQTIPFDDVAVAKEALNLRS